MGRAVIGVARETGDLDGLDIWDDSRNKKPERCILCVPVSNLGKAIDSDSYLWI
jgi:hypothetical protein